jgi:regulator of replication initiation timing
MPRRNKYAVVREQIAEAEERIEILDVKLKQLRQVKQEMMERIEILDVELKQLRQVKQEMMEQIQILRDVKEATAKNDNKLPVEETTVLSSSDEHSCESSRATIESM